MVTISGGMVNAGNVWTAGTRNLTVPSTVTTGVYPDLAAPVSVDSGDNSTYGAWTEIVAATANAIIPLYILFVTGDADLDSFGFGIQLGVGAAASEAAVAQIPLVGFRVDDDYPCYCPIISPPIIASGARISIRAVTTKGAGNPVSFTVYLIYANTSTLTQA